MSLASRPLCPIPERCKALTNLAFFFFFIKIFPDFLIKKVVFMASDSIILTTDWAIYY